MCFSDPWDLGPYFILYTNLSYLILSFLVFCSLLLSAFSAKLSILSFLAETH